MVIVPAREEVTSPPQAYSRQECKIMLASLGFWNCVFSVAVHHVSPSNLVPTAVVFCGHAIFAVYGYDIQKVNVYQDRFLVGRTQATLLLGDLDTCKLTEIAWESDMTEKFYFEHEKVSQMTHQHWQCYSSSELLWLVAQ